MTEAQFEKTLTLWKECEKHGLTTAQMYHISEIIRSNVNPDTVIDAYHTAIIGNMLPLSRGVPKKISLYSNGICYGPCPEPDEERIQKVTVSASGKVYITMKNYEGKTLRREQISISPEEAIVWLNNVNIHLSVLIDSMMITDVGSWDAEIVNEKDEEYRMSGCLTEGDNWLDKYSDELREMVDMPELYAFNEVSYSPTRLCSCEFEYGGKQYYYKTNDKSIHIGDMVLVPVGNKGAKKEARVTNMENLDEADPPMDLDKIKEIISKVEPDPPLYTDFTDLQKLNGDIMSEVLAKEEAQFGIVKRAIDSIDCEGLLELEAPHNEYDGESQLIAARIRPENDVYHIASVIADIMTSSFGKPFGIDSFIGIAAQIKRQLVHLYEVDNASLSEKGSSIQFQKVKDLIDRIKTEKDLAKLFAYADNNLWDAADNEDDYERGTEAYRKAKEETQNWGKIVHQLEDMIFTILRQEGVAIPESAQISVLIPFMERNGYVNDCGWWEPTQDKK